MPDRWIAWCRARVREPERTRLFEPALADLEQDWRRRARGPFVIWRRRLQVAHLAVEARRLGRRPGEGPSLPFMERARMWIQDAHRAVRRLARQPAFVLTAVLTLALGIGANLAAGAYVHSFLLAPVNAPDPDHLFRVMPGTAGGASTQTVSWPEFLEARDAVPGVELAAHATATAQVGPAEASELRTVQLVSGNYFDMLRLVPAAGRLLAPRDDVAPLASPVVVLSEAYWRARHGADPQIVGRTIAVNGAEFEVVGVAPAGFRGDRQSHTVDLWVPVTMQAWVRPRGTDMTSRNWGWLQLLGRRGADVAPGEVAARFDAFAGTLNERFPPADSTGGVVFDVVPAAAVAPGERAVLEPVLVATLAFTGLLFLVTCANLAGVMQSRLIARRRELAIRQSLGAGRGRVLGEWLAECLALAVAGGAVGLLAARGIVAWLGALHPPAQLVGDLSFAASFDARLVPMALGLSLLAAVVFGVLPAWRTGARAPIAWLRTESGTTTAERSTWRLRRVAVVAQLALAGVLLFSATLLARSLANQQGYETGFETQQLGLMSFDLRRQRVSDADFARLTGALLDRVRQDPDVVAADVALSVPLGFGRDTMGVRIPGYEPPDERGYVPLDFNVVGADYFDALGVPFVAGGTWPPGVGAGGPPQVVVNETAARRFWDGRNPVGQPIEVIGQGTATVSGVVSDVAYYDVGEAPIPYLYVPAGLQPPGAFILHVRTTGDPAPVLTRLVPAVASVDARLAAHDVLTFEALRRIPLFPVRLLAAAALVFSALAFLLASVGLYGVISMSVGDRTREIGVRIALGARPATVLGGVVRDALWLAGIGLALALAAGYAVHDALETWLFGLPRFDVATALAVAGLLAVLAVVASWIPARRAARVDPIQALRGS